MLPCWSLLSAAAVSNKRPSPCGSVLSSFSITFYYNLSIPYPLYLHSVREFDKNLTPLKRRICRNREEVRESPWEWSALLREKETFMKKY
jgi:hypothetical protein